MTFVLNGVLLDRAAADEGASERGVSANCHFHIGLFTRTQTQIPLPRPVRQYPI